MQSLHRLRKFWEARKQEELVLVTLVSLQGSGYRRPGAFMVVTSRGEWEGTVSGGCLEKQIASKAFALTGKGPAVLQIDTGSGEFLPSGNRATGCEGILELLLQPIGPVDSMKKADPVAAFFGAMKTGESFWMVHIYDGPAEHLGAWCVLSAGGQILESDQEFPRSLLAKSEWSPGETAGVRIDDYGLLRQWVRPPQKVLIFGGGPDVGALVEVLATQAWDVVVLTPEPTSRKHAFSGAEVHHVTTVEEIRAYTAEIGPETAAVVMSHRFQFDQLVLKVLASKELSYLGILGPRTRTARQLEGLLTEGVSLSERFYDTLVAPVGLDLGGEDPWEIGLAIAAELLAHRKGASGGRLRDRKGPIHRPHQVLTQGFDLSPRLAEKRGSDD